MIEQWMHVRAKNTDLFLFENSNRPKFNNGEKFRFEIGQNLLIYSIRRSKEKKEQTKSR